MSDYYDMMQFLREQGLAQPLVPQALADAVQRTGPSGFAATVRLPGGESRLRLGLEGHGINSNTLRYELHHGPLSLVLSRRWGNVYDDDAQAAERIEGLFGLANRAVALADKLDRASRLPAGQRLVVRDTDDAEAGWGWVPIQTGEPADLAPASLPTFDALMDLMDRDHVQ